jgi:hypothetical protein
MRKPRVHRPSAPESGFLSARGQPNRRSMPAPLIVLREASGLRSRRRSRARPDPLRVTSTKACAPGIVNGPSSGAWRSPHHQLPLRRRQLAADLLGAAKNSHRLVQSPRPGPIRPPSWEASAWVVEPTPRSYSGLALPESMFFLLVERPHSGRLRPPFLLLAGKPEQRRFGLPFELR